MKVIDSEMDMRITYTMTLAEARFLQRICDGYVGLPRFLHTVTARFPESEEKLERIVHSLHEGMSDLITRAEATHDVYTGKAVAVSPSELHRLRASEAALNEFKRQQGTK